MPTCFEINTPGAAGEIIDGEAVALHLGSGHYFSMQGSAALIWAGVEQGASVAAIAEALRDFYRIEAGEAAQAVDGFLEELAREGLVRACETPKAAAMTVPDGIDHFYGTPAIEVYKDMQDLLLLDPIHEVDEAGWPLLPKEAA